MEDRGLPAAGAVSLAQSDHAACASSDRIAPRLETGTRRFLELVHGLLVLRIIRIHRGRLRGKEGLSGVRRQQRGNASTRIDMPTPLESSLTE